MRHAALITLLLLAVSCATTAPRVEPRILADRPLFTFVFDDGQDTDFLIGKDLFAEHGAVACTAVTTAWIGWPGHLSAEQVLGLRDAGWEVLSHTVSHPNLNSLDQDEVERELRESKAVLERLGVAVNNIVYPYNKSTKMVRSIAAKYYRSGRGGRNEYNKEIADRHELRSFSDKRDPVLMREIIDRAYRDREWLIIYHHDIDAKVTITGRNGWFSDGEPLLFSPSGATGRLTRSAWLFFSGSLHFAPLSGVPQPGDRIMGTESGATADLARVVFNERVLISDMLRYIRSTYPGMRIVTIDQGLDIIGAPKRGQEHAGGRF